MAERKASQGILEVAKIRPQTITAHVIGLRPIILNRLSQKTRMELLAPAGRKTSAQKQSSLKHDPFAEFEAAPYTLADPAARTYLAVMSSAFKGAMATAALDLPGTRKSQIGRLVWVEEEFTSLYGLPYLYMSPVRSSDINHTPDIRTRAIVKDWACEIKITFVETLIKEQAIANLLDAAGLTVGVGDWRNEKGKGTFGQFTLTHAADPRFKKIVAEGGRAAQIAAMQTPEAYDVETSEMLEWWSSEVVRRGFKMKADPHAPLLDEEEDEDLDDAVLSANGVTRETDA